MIRCTAVPDTRRCELIPTSPSLGLPTNAIPDVHARVWAALLGCIGRAIDSYRNKRRRDERENRGSHCYHKHRCPDFLSRDEQERQWTEDA